MDNRNQIAPGLVRWLTQSAKTPKEIRQVAGYFLIFAVLLVALAILSKWWLGVYVFSLGAVAFGGYAGYLFVKASRLAKTDGES